MKILIVDDEPDDRRLAMYYIKKSIPDADFVEIYSKKRFYEEIEKEFDAVITDYWLRWTNGIDVFREVKKRAPFVPVIMLTGTGTEEIAVEALKMGIDDYVIKTERHIVNLGARLKRAIEIEEIKRKEALLVSIVENSNEAVVSISRDGCIIYANKAVETIFGWKAEEIIGKKFSIFAIDEKEQLNQFKEAIEKGGARFETVRKAKDGRIVPVIISVVPFKDAEGKLLFSSAIMIDISDIKTYQNKINYLNKLLKIIRNINQLIARSKSIEKFLQSVVTNLKHIEEYEICIEYENKIYGNRDICKYVEKFDEGLHSVNGRELLVSPFSNGKLCILKEKFNKEEKELIREVSEDISLFIETRKMRQIIDKKQETYNRLFENAEVGVYRTSRDGKILFANKYLAELLGYESVEELKKRHLNDEKWFVDIKRKDFIEKIEKDGYYRGYSSWLRKDGTPVYVKEFSVLVIENGEEYFEGIVVDVTKMKELIEKLREAERDWKNIFESLGEPVIILSPSWNILDANHTALNLMGMKKEDIINKKCYNLFHKMKEAPGDCPLRQLLASNKPTTTVMDVEAVNKRFLVSVFPVYDENGRLKKIIHYMKDVEEILNIMEKAEEMERRYTQIFDNSPNAIIIFDDNLRLIDINKTACTILGKEKEDFIGKNLKDIISKHYHTILNQIFRDIKKNVKPPPFFVNIKDKDENLHTMELTVNEIKIGEKKYYMGIARDVTEKAEIESLLNKIMETAPIGILIYQDDRIVYANKSTFSITGYSEEDMAKMKFWEYIDESMREEVKQRGRERQKGVRVKPEIYELPIITKDGNKRYGIFSFSNITYRGRPAGFAIFMDITDYKKMEEKIHMEEEKFKALVENAGDGIYIITPAGFEYVNPAFEKITGYRREEITGGKFSFWELIHEDDVEKIRRRLEARKKKKAIKSKYKFRLVRKNGEIRHVEVTTVDIGKDEPRVVGILRDVTTDIRLKERLKQDIKEFKELSEYAPSGIFILRDSKFIYANKAATKLLGYGKREIVGEDFWKFVYEKDTQKLKEKIDRWFQKPPSKRVIKTELRIKRKDGKIKWLSITATQIEYGDKPATIIIANDVTSKKIAEERLKELMEIYREVAFKINRSLSIEEMCRGVLEEIKKRTGIDYANIFVYDRYLKQLIPKYFYGYNKTFMKRTMIPYDITDTRYEAVKTFKEKRIRYVEDIRKHKPLSFNWDIYKRYKVKELYSIPLISEGEVIGVLQIMTRENNKLERYKINLVESIAELTATGIARIMKQYNLTQEASHHLLNPYTMASGFLEKLKDKIGEDDDINKAMKHLNRIKNVILNMKRYGKIEEET